MKGKNRHFFEDVLRNNLDRALGGVDHEGARRLRGRIEVPLGEGANLDVACTRLSKVFGVTSFSFANPTTTDLGAMQDTAWQLLREEPFETFRIAARRSEKAYPMTSMEINAAVGSYVLDRRPARVDLANPDMTCFIELTGKQSFVYTRRHPGPGGLPVGVGGIIVCLLSGGIDSPVAAYKLMRRGCRIVFVHFHGEPFTDRSSQGVARELVQHLTEYQMRSLLYLVPFGEIQREISLQCDPDYRIVLYRRLMIRIAEQIARREKALALGTGESLGQVASQTLQNLRSIDEAATLPVLRPLIGDDKRDIIAAAEALGTYEASITPHVEDCCPLFMPPQPVTRSRLEEVLAVESKLDVEALVRRGMGSVKVERFDAPWLDKAQ
ncbi:MAG: tRNA 4-thiouridine(8) synthase ThiI [Armatimonadetes bacterium]|nr:tRNA 4-thiouridine(8) synthase ThiI [Armatimonadota bacterium]